MSRSFHSISARTPVRQRPAKPGLAHSTFEATRTGMLQPTRKPPAAQATWSTRKSFMIGNIGFQRSAKMVF